MPKWVLHGILYMETRSYYEQDGTLTYVDQRRGRSGERGPFQMTRIAFRQVAKAGEVFADLETDKTFAKEVAIRYLNWLHTNYPGSWEKTVAMWNTGPTGYRSNKRRGDRYAEKAKTYGEIAMARLSEDKEKKT